MPQYQKNRIYSLIVGKEGDAVEINNLQIQFEITKTSSNKDKKNVASVKIFNLSEDRRKKLDEDYVNVALAVGYSDTGLVPLFSGQVTNVSSAKMDTFNSSRQGTDLVTKLDLDELWYPLNTVQVSAQIPAGNTLREVIQRVVKDIPEITRQEITGERVAMALPNGYSMYGSPRQILDKLSRDFDIEYQIDQGVLYVSDSEGSWSEVNDGVPLIGQMSGLIERPEYINEDAKRIRRQNAGKPARTKQKPNAIRVKILLNPSIIAGSVVKLDFEPYTGYYKVDEVKHSGGYRDNDWFSELRLTERV